MARQKTYLELTDGSSHKFYEVAVSGASVTIRYGRIGTDGQTKTTDYPTPAKAKAEAEKKLAAKRREGYAEARAGAKPKPVAKAARAAKPKKAVAPVLWSFRASKKAAFGIHIEKERCWVGSNDGLIHVLTHQGEVLQSYQLPDGVGCIVADDAWRYAGCDDGNVYDLSGRTPRVAYELKKGAEVLWLDVYRGQLAVSDEDGRVAVVNFDGEEQWQKQSSGPAGWMVRCDAAGVYHGHDEGVTAYDWASGKKRWHRSAGNGVTFGWQEGASLYACTYNGLVCQLSKDGKPGVLCQCDTGLLSCATAEDGKFIFAADHDGYLLCFDAKGQRLWKLATGCGGANSMEYFEGRLYLVTDSGYLACVDVSEAAIRAAEAGTVPEARSVARPNLVAAKVGAALEVTSDTSRGVVVECYQQGRELHIRVISPGFEPGWRVQFPRDIREAGAKYVVDEIRTAAQGGFYRALGEIRRLRA